MLIKQLSVFLEDRSGRLTDLTQILAEHEINIAALSLAETDYGIVRMVVENPILQRSSFVKQASRCDLPMWSASICPTGRALHEVLKILADNAINGLHVRLFKQGGGIGGHRAADIGQVVDVLEKNEMELLRQSDIYQV